MEKFTITNRHGLKIVGELYTTTNSVGLAFVMHGLGGYKEQPGVVTILETLIETGYAVVNFDATNSFGESEGNFEKATMELHYQDLEDVIAWAKKEPWYHEPFVIAGHSLGGYAAARYAEVHPGEVKAIFPFALAVSGKLSWEATKKLGRLEDWEKSGWKIEESKSKPGIVKRLPWSHMEERMKHDLRPDAGKLTMPVLFIVGENDTSCPPDSQKMLFDLVPGPKELHIISDAPHTFKDPEHLAKMKTIFKNWLKKIQDK